MLWGYGILWCLLMDVRCLMDVMVFDVGIGVFPCPNVQIVRQARMRLLGLVVLWLFYSCLSLDPLWKRFFGVMVSWSMAISKWKLGWIYHQQQHHDHHHHHHLTMGVDLDIQSGKQKMMENNQLVSKRVSYQFPEFQRCSNSFLWKI